MKKRLIGTVLLLVSLMFAPQLSYLSAKAQKTQAGKPAGASVSGAVSDRADVPIPEAKVTLTNSKTGAVRTAATDDDGNYRFDGVAPGTYTFKIEAQSFGTHTKTNVVVASQSLTFNVKLSSTMSITEDAAAIADTSREFYSVAFSPDGRYILTGDDGNDAILWDVNTGKEIRRFGQSHTVRSVAFSQDGSNVLIGGGGFLDPGYARLLETATGKEVQRYERHVAPVNSALFSPDKRYVLTGSGLFIGLKQDNAARLWDVTTGRLLRKFEGHKKMVTSVAFSPDGSYVATASYDGTVRLWDAAKGGEVRTFGDAAAAPEWVNSVAFSPDGRYLLAGGSDNLAHLWETATGKEVRKFEGHTGSILSVAFSPDGRYVLTGGGDSDDEKKDYSVRLWDASTGKEIRRFEGHTKPVRAVAFSPDGRYIFTGSEDKTARLWNVATGKEIRKFKS
jgi:WD40 repeat protein